LVDLGISSRFKKHGFCGHDEDRDSFFSFDDFDGEGEEEEE
jgi:hypothetical protein